MEEAIQTDANLPPSSEDVMSEARQAPAEELEDVGRGDILSVDKKEYCVGETVMVTWEMRSRPLHERDFIGMFEVEESASADGEGVGLEGAGHRHLLDQEKLLDSRMRGDTSVSGGCLQWSLVADILPPSELLHYS